MVGVITASQPSWTAPFTRLSPRCFAKVVTMLRRQAVVGRSVGDEDQQPSAVAAGSGGSPPHASPLRLIRPLHLGEALGPLCRGCGRVRRFGGRRGRAVEGVPHRAPTARPIG